MAPSAAAVVSDDTVAPMNTPWAQSRDSLTSGQAAELLHLEDFDALARDFDEVVYGRRPPGREDVVRAREEWARVLARAGNS